MKSVTMNRLQERLNEVRRTELSPGGYAALRTWGLVKKVWDASAISEAGETLPAKVKALTNAYPGALFATVVCVRPTVEVTIPFAESEQIVYSNYGNAAAIENTVVRITYWNRDPSTGEITVAHSYGSGHVDINEQAETADIGAVTK